MESINPNDIMSLDLNSISYLTLKNGNMILLDDSVPQKTNGDIKNIPESSNLSRDDIKSPVKELILEISSPLELTFEGQINKNKYKSDFKSCSKIIKNINFNYIGTKININKFNNAEKENLNLYNINNQENKNNLKEVKDILKNGTINNNINTKNNESSDSLRQSLKESTIKPITTNKNHNEHEVDFSGVEKLDFNQSNANTNLSIPLMNFTNNLDNKSVNNNNTQGNRRKSRASKVYGGTGRKNRISVNAVCSLNIKAEEKYKINLISQFNGIVDKLNAERDKKPIYDLIENEKDRNVKYYELYKNKIHNNIKKNIDALNNNYAVDTISDYNKIDNNFKTMSNYYKRKSIEFNGFNKKNGNDYGNRFFKENKVKSPTRLSSNKIQNFRDKIYRYSSELVFPSNKMIHV